MTGPILARIAAGALASFTLVSAGAAGVNAVSRMSRAGTERPAVVTMAQAPCGAPAVINVRAGVPMTSARAAVGCGGR